jgi:hypothetical protein
MFRRRQGGLGEVQNLDPKINRYFNPVSRKESDFKNMASGQLLERLRTTYTKTDGEIKRWQAAQVSIVGFQTSFKTRND